MLDAVESSRERRKGTTTMYRLLATLVFFVFGANGIFSFSPFLPAGDTPTPAQKSQTLQPLPTSELRKRLGTSPSLTLGDHVGNH